MSEHTNPHLYGEIRYCDRALLVGPYLGLCITERAFNEEVKRLNIEEKVAPWVGEGAKARTWHLYRKPDGRLCCIVTLDPSALPTDDPTGIVALLVHEAVHVWQEYCDYIGEARPGREIEAYAIQNISAELIEAYSYLTNKDSAYAKGNEAPPVDVGTGDRSAGAPEPSDKGGDDPSGDQETPHSGIEAGGQDAAGTAG